MSYQVPAPPYGPAPAYGPHPPPVRPRLRGSLVAAAGLSLGGLLVGGAAGAAITFGTTERNSSAATTAPVIALSPEAAQEQTCGVLKANYEAVADAVDERNKFNASPWTDPGLLASVNTLVDASSRLASDLESSLGPETPSNLRSAAVDYVAGLRALGISERNHSKDLQLNGVALFYNQVLDAPLRICGMRR